MKFAEMKTKSIDELKSFAVDLKKEQFNLRFQAASGELANVGRVREVRRTIARVLMLIGQKKKG